MEFQSARKNNHNIWKLYVVTWLQNAVLHLWSTS